MLEISMTKSSSINVIELRRLLHQIKDLRPDICIRIRLMGELWQNHYLRVIMLNESGVVLNNEVTDKLIVIQDLKMIMQLELDNIFQQYQPNFHYSITIDETA